MIWSRVDGDAGPRVVLTHGWGDTGAVWDAQVAALRTRARVVTWDLPGHGRSDGPDDPAAYTREIALAHLDELVGDEPAVLVGHSLGGQLSLAFAIRHPERVLGLALVGTGPGYRDAAGMAEWNRGVERRAEQCEADGDRALAHAIRGFVAQHDSSIMDGASSVAVPTLVVVGAKDRAFLAAADWFERKLPDVTKVVVPDAGHTVQQHQPDAVNRALLDLVDASVPA
jgi:pimeloyl-ACP methyl ester carboxylesterase